MIAVDHSTPISLLIYKKHLVPYTIYGFCIIRVFVFFFCRTIRPLLAKAKQITEGDGAIPVMVQLQRSGDRLRSYTKVKPEIVFQ